MPAALIARQRRPYCPINGVVVLLPLAATDSDDTAAQATTACELDLTVVSEMLNLRVHQLFVVDERSVLVGVISTMDVLRHLLPE